MESKKEPLTSLYEDPVPAVKKTSARAQSSEEENWSIASLKRHPLRLAVSLPTSLW
jgi:hypothetical protein